MKFLGNFLCVAFFYTHQPVYRARVLVGVPVQFDLVLSYNPQAFSHLQNHSECEVKGMIITFDKDMLDFGNVTYTYNSHA